MFLLLTKETKNADIQNAVAGCRLLFLTVSRFPVTVVHDFASHDTSVGKRSAVLVEPHDDVKSIISARRPASLVGLTLIIELLAMLCMMLTGAWSTFAVDSWTCMCQQHDAETYSSMTLHYYAQWLSARQWEATSNECEFSPRIFRSTKRSPWTIFKPRLPNWHRFQFRLYNVINVHEDNTDEKQK